MLLHPQECQLLLATIWNQRESWRWVFTTASQRVNPAHIIVLDVWSLELWQNDFLLFQPPQPGSSLSQQWGETHREDHALFSCRLWLMWPKPDILIRRRKLRPKWGGCTWKHRERQAWWSTRRPEAAGSLQELKRQEESSWELWRGAQPCWHWFWTPDLQSFCELLST